MSGARDEGRVARAYACVLDKRRCAEEAKAFGFRVLATRPSPLRKTP